MFILTKENLNVKKERKTYLGQSWGSKVPKGKEKPGQLLETSEKGDVGGHATASESLWNGSMALIADKGKLGGYRWRVWESKGK